MYGEDAAGIAEEQFGSRMVLSLTLRSLRCTEP